MTAITLPKDLEDWARAEVAAGRAESVEALVAEALRERRAEIDYVQNALDQARAEVAEGRAIPLRAMLAELDAWIVEDEADAKTHHNAAE